MRRARVFVLLLNCIACNACAAVREEDEVILSGRVQLDPESREPVANAFVRAIDTNNSRRCFVTACDGTFVVRRGDVPSLALPLMEVTVERVDAPREPAGLTRTVWASRMRGRVREGGSCNGCHAGGVSLFLTADEVPPDLRGPSASCTPGAIACPEDRVVDDQLDLVRDFATYESRVHAVVVARCGECHDRGEARSTFDWVRGPTVMENARGHGGVESGGFADQCLADWLGVPRASCRVSGQSDPCRRVPEGGGIAFAAPGVLRPWRVTRSSFLFSSRARRTRRLRLLRRWKPRRLRRRLRRR